MTDTFFLGVNLICNKIFVKACVEFCAGKTKTSKFHSKITFFFPISVFSALRCTL